MDNEVSKLYKALIGKGYSTKNIGDEETFAGKMLDGSNRKELYDWVKSRGDYNIGDYDSFEKRMTGAAIGKPANGPVNGNTNQAASAEEVAPVAPVAPVTVRENRPATPLLDNPDKYLSKPVDAAPRDNTSVAAIPAQAENKDYKKGVEERIIDSHYVQPKAEKIEDVSRNYYNRFKQTEMGQQLEAEMMKKQKEVSEAYASEFLKSPEYKALTRQYSGDQLNAKANELFKELYSDSIDRAMQPYEEDFAKAAYDRYGGEIKKEEQVFIKKGVGERVAEMDKDIDAQLDEVKKRLRSYSGQGGNAGNALMGSSSYNRETARDRNQEYLLETAKKVNGKSLRMIDEAGKKDGGLNALGRGVRDEVFDFDNWLFGIADYAKNVNLEKIAEKADKGEPLSKAEQALMDACLNNLATQSYYSSDLSRAYKAGQTTGASLPFMLEFVVNPLSASGSAMARGMLKYGLKKFGKVATKKASKMAARLVGDAAAAAGMTMTTGLGRVASGYKERRMGDFVYDIDSNGKAQYKGRENQQDAGEALARSFASTFLEDQSEMIFNPFKGAGGVLLGQLEKWRPGLTKQIKNMKVADWYNQVYSNKTFRDIAERTQFHGLPEEYMEEVYNNFANVAIGEMDLKDATDLDNNIDTFLGLAPTTVAMSMIGLGSLAHQRVKSSIKGRKIERRFVDQLGEEEFERLSSLRGNKEIGDYIKGVIRSDEYTTEEKKLIIEAAYHQAEKNAEEEGREQQTPEQNAADDAFVEGAEQDHRGNYATELSREALGGQLDAGVRSSIDTMVEDGATATEVENLLSGLDGESAKVARDYYHAVLAEEGAIEQARETVEEGVRSFEDALVPLTDANGNVTTATYKEAPVFVRSERGDNAIVQFEDGHEEMVLSRHLEERQATPAAELVKKHREKATAQAQEAMQNRFNLHPNTRIPYKGMELWNGDTPYIIGEVRDNADGTQTVVAYPGGLNAETGKMEVKNGSAPIEMTYNEAMQLQNDYYNRMDAANSQQADAQAEQSQVDNMSENQPQNEGTPSDGESNVQNKSADTLSKSEDSKEEAPKLVTKRDGTPDFIASGKDASLAFLQDKYKEKTEHKIEVTRKAAAEKLKKAEDALFKAQQAYDDSPIGAEDKAEAALNKAKEAYDAARKEADFWTVMGKKVEDNANKIAKEEIRSASEVQNDNSAVASDSLQSEPIADNGSTSNGTPSQQEESVIWRTPNDATTSSAERQGLDYEQSNVAETTAKGSEITPQSTLSESKDSKAINNRQEETEQYAGHSLTEDEANELLSRMEEEAEVSTEQELTAETWNETFDKNNSIETPIGRVKMGENQITKFFEKNREKEFGMVAPTLRNPDVIIEEKSEAKDGEAERPSSFLFVKTFNRNGEKIKFYASITVKQNGMEVSVSSHYLNKNKVARAMKEGKVLYTREALLPNSSEWRLAEHQNNDVPDLLPTQGNNASSENKDSKAVDNKQETEEKIASAEAEVNTEVAQQQLPLLDAPADISEWMRQHPGQTPTTSDLFDESQSKKQLGKELGRESKTTDKGVTLTKVNYEGGYVLEARHGSDFVKQSYYPNGQIMTNPKVSISMNPESFKKYVGFDENGLAYMKQGEILNSFMDAVESDRKPSLESEPARQQKEEKAEPMARESKPHTEDGSGRIDDYGERITGARKDMLRDYAKSLDNANVESFVALPLSKAFKRPNLKKLVEEGALREKDARFAEAILASYLSQDKPKQKTRGRYAAMESGDSIRKWAEKCAKGVDMLRTLFTADGATRDKYIEEIRQRKAYDEKAVNERKRKLAEWNPGKKFDGTCYGINPVALFMDVYERLGYDEIGGVKLPVVNVIPNSGYDSYELIAPNGKKLYPSRPMTSYEDVVNEIVYQTKRRNGDIDNDHPESEFIIRPSDPIEEVAGYRVITLASLSSTKQNEHYFKTKEEADAFAKEYNVKHPKGIATVKENRKTKGYGKYTIVYKRDEGINNAEHTYIETELGFATMEEARAAINERYDDLNDFANAKDAELATKSSKTRQKKDYLRIQYYSEDGGKTFKYAIVLDDKYSPHKTIWNTIPYALADGFPTRKEAEKYVEEHRAEWDEKIAEIDRQRHEFVYFDGDAKGRIGEDYRKGQDVTAEQFTTQFGFRGVQFGNWANQRDRQAALNNAFDAFMDLARLLDVSPRSISLNGELGIAFGARGSGNAAAHYEREQVVINLTKTQGAGSLAHEWWHALDNYFGRQSGVAMGMVSENKRITMRKELREAFNSLMDHVAASGYDERSAERGRSYWGTRREETARLFETWVNDELRSRGERNHFLVGKDPEAENKIAQYNYDFYVWSLKGSSHEPMSFEDFKKTPMALAGYVYPSREELETFGRDLRHIFDTVQERVDEETGNVIMYHRDNVVTNTSPAEAALRDAVIDRLRESGMEVITDVEEGQRVLDMANEGVYESRKKKSAPEAAELTPEREAYTTAVSSADGAKILNNIDSLASKYEEKSSSPKTFIGDLAKALNIPDRGTSSKYATFETKGGKVVTFRISNHNATVRNFDNENESEGISIVVSGTVNNGITNNGNAHVVEYFYSEKELRRAEGKPLASIVRSIKQALYSGEFKDETGLAERQEVNADDVVRYNKVYHGSGANFDAFDHSHIGEGEGAQVFGWGTYVTEVEEIGQQYASKLSLDDFIINVPDEFSYSSDAKRAFFSVAYEMAKNGKSKEEVIRSRRIGNLKIYEKTKRLYEKKGMALSSEYEENFHKALKLLDTLEKFNVSAYIVKHDKYGHLYTVEIPDDTGENYLDWDKPLTDGQKDVISKAIKKLKIDLSYYESRGFSLDGSGKDAYEFLSYALRKTKKWEDVNAQRAVSKFLSSLGFTGIKYPADYTRGGREDGAKNYVIFNEADAKITDHVRFFRTPSGEAYGYTVGNRIYIDPHIANSETPIHEYAHLWATALRKGNAKEWKNVVKLMKDTPLWEEVKKRYPELTNESEIADEVLAHYSGRRGAERLREEQRKALENKDVTEAATAVSAINKVRRALNVFWKGVADFLHIHYTTAEEVADRVMKDLLDGVNPIRMMDGGKSLRPDTPIHVIDSTLEHGLKSYKEAKDWAKEHIARTYSSEETGGKGEIRISNTAIDKYLSQSAVDKSDSKDVHLSVLKVLPDVIRESVDAEQHPDYKKDEKGVRSTENGINPNVTIHRLYSAVRIGDKMYRVKVTLKEDSTSKEPKVPHSYEATKIELFAGTLGNSESSLSPNTNNSITAANLLKGVEKSYGSGKFFEDYFKVREQFIGEKGAEAADRSEEVNTRLDNLRVAREMEADKKDAKAIKMATGWERGADGKWRYEIPDIKYHPKGDAEFNKLRDRQPWSKELDKLEDKLFDGEDLTESETERFDELAKLDNQFKAEFLSREKNSLADWVENKELFAAYPELKRVEMVFTDQLPPEQGGYYSERDNRLVVNTAYAMGGTESVIAHEIQHAIQRIEGFARGGNTKEAMMYLGENKAEDVKIKKQVAYKLSQENGLGLTKQEVDSLIGHLEYEDISDEELQKQIDALCAKHDITEDRLEDIYDMGAAWYEAYQRIAGEVEARNVQSRMRMSEEERRKSLAAETEDVAREDQIFLNGDGRDSSQADNVRFRSDESAELEEANEKFNQELEDFTMDTADKFYFNLGKPSSELLSAGVENRPIRLHGSKVAKKIRKHGFQASELKDLPKAIAHPIAVFDNLGREGNRSILTELKTANGNFLVTIDLGKGIEADFDIVSSVFGKQQSSVLEWINKGVMKYVDKEKALNYLHLSAPIAEALDNSKLSSATNIVENFENPSVADEKVSETDVPASIEDEVSHLQETFHTPVRTVRSDAELTEDERRMVDNRKRAAERRGMIPNIKGWFDPKTGEVVIYMPGTESVEDVRKTFLHEVVGHKGLRELFGAEAYDGKMNELFSRLPEAEQEGVRAAAGTKYKGDISVAMDEYLAEQVEKDELPSWWGRVVSAVRDMLHRLGFDMKLTNNDVRYLLWRSRNKLRETDLLDVAEDMANRNKWGIGGEEKRFRDISMVGEPSLYVTERNVGAARDMYETMVSNASYKLQESYQDSMLGLKKMMEAIEKATGSRILDYENPYMAENALSSKNFAEMEAYRQLVYKPILQEVKRLMDGGMKYDDIVDYLYAKHGLERNEYMAKQEAQEKFDADPNSGKTLQDFIDECREKDYSGLTALTGKETNVEAEAEAQKMVDTAEQANNMDGLWKVINAATDATLSKQYESGLIDKETYDKIKGMYKYYIPLRGWEETTAAEEYDYLNSSHSNFSNPLIKAKGRKSKADDPIATIGNNAESAIVKGNRNLMKQKFLTMVQNHRTDLASVSDLWMEKRTAIDANGNKSEEWVSVFPDIPDDATAQQVDAIVAQFNKDMQARKDAGEEVARRKDKPNVPYRLSPKEQSEHQVVVYRGGKPYVITVNANPRAAQAINGATNPDAERNVILQALGKANRFMSTNFTARNPGFIAVNFVRDGIYANSIVRVKESADYANDFHKEWLDAARRMGGLLKRYENGTLDMNNTTDRLFSEFIKNGGETGYTFVNSVEDYKGAIAKELKRMDSKSRQAWGKLADTMDYYGRMAEDVSRFAAYVTSRKHGRSIDRSVNDAKEISVNFNKKGSGSKMIGEHDNGLVKLLLTGSQIGRTGYIFWNAGVQSLANFIRLAKNHKAAFAKMAGSLFGMGFALPMLSAAFGGDDDYYNLPENTRRQNICFKVSGTKEYVLIPLPIELRAIYGLGELFASAALGKENLSAGMVAKKALEQVSQLFPIDAAGEGGMAFAPSYAKPIFEVAGNKSWTGLPIYKENGFNKDMPEWTKAYKSTSPTLVKLSATLNELTGGNKYKSGMIDFNPAMVEHLVSGYLGGVGTTITQLGHGVEAIWNEDMRTMKNVPIASRLFREADERAEEKRIDDVYFDNKKRFDKIGRQERGFKKEMKESYRDPMEYAEWRKRYNDLIKTDEYKKYLQFKSQDKALKKWQDAYNRTGDEETERRIFEMKSEMNRMAK